MTALATSPFFTWPVGMASLIATTTLVAERRVAAPRPAEHADDQRLPGAGIVRDLENAFPVAPS